MAILIPSSTSLNSSNSPFLLLPISQNRTHLKVNAQITTRTVQSSNEEENFSTVSIETDNKKKKRKKKLRPSFYEQTIERWSLKVSSPRTKFPWQEQKAMEKITDSSAQVAGLTFENHYLDSSRKTRSGSNPNFDNPEKKMDFDGKTVEKLDSLGVRREIAPWVHGKQKQRFKLDGECEDVGNESENAPDASQLNGNVDERFNFDKNIALQSSQSNALSHNLRNGVSCVSFIVDELKNSADRKDKVVNETFGKTDEACKKTILNHDIIKLTGPVELPWERKSDGSEVELVGKKSNTELAEKTIPENELQRLRNVALRMKERIKVGAAGVTDSLVESIHMKWRLTEVVKLRFEGAPTLHMKKTHELLEMRTGGIVIWRSGSSVVLYRGMTHTLPCVQSYTKTTDFTQSYTKTTDCTQSYTKTNDTELTTKASSASLEPFVDKTSAKSNNSDRAPLFKKTSEISAESPDIDEFMNQLGPRYKDWSGTKPLPIDADLLPSVVPGYTPPFRLLPYKTRNALRDRQMTSLRRLARTISPHFALGRNRQHQGLARAMVKLWEKSSIAKIAIKRGVPNTNNERMAEEIKKLTGGVLVSRNKEYIVFYRGNDYVTPSIREAMLEKQKLAAIHQDDEEIARLKASDTLVFNSKAVKRSLLAGTLAETLEANTCFGQQPSSEEREKMKKDLALSKQASLVTFLERKISIAKAKVRKAERALAKVQKHLEPAELPSDLETVTDEERALFRNMGLKMRAYLMLGRRGVFGGTVENMHLNWKHKELVKILVKGKSFAQVKHIAINLEAESGGILISLDKTTKGYAIIVYRGKNYVRPFTLKPKNLLTKRQALARAIELQRREALNHHIRDLNERIQLLKSQLNETEAGKGTCTEFLDIDKDDSSGFDDDTEDEDEEAYLQTYSSAEEDDDGASAIEI